MQEGMVGAGDEVIQDIFSNHQMQNIDADINSIQPYIVSSQQCDATLYHSLHGWY